MCFAEHYGDGVYHGSVSTVSFSKIRNGLGVRSGENRFLVPNRKKAREKEKEKERMKRTKKGRKEGRKVRRNKGRKEGRNCCRISNPPRE